MTKIQWTSDTWNPIGGCSKVSPGCENCYAMQIAYNHAQRFKQNKYKGLTKKLANGKINWTGEIRIFEKSLKDNRITKNGKNKMIFVNSMSDLFHESLHFEDILKITEVMHKHQHLTFQVLTKRPFKMEQFIKKYWGTAEFITNPLPNVWWGVSTEDQKTFDERIPYLLSTPAAVRWISAEPLINEIDLSIHLKEYSNTKLKLDWVVVGGESGNYARECKLEWIEKIVEDCKNTGVPVFVKQLGAVLAKKMKLKDRKGGDIKEFPEHLRIREYPIQTTS